MPNIAEFRNVKAVAAYAGLSPRHHESGSIHWPSRIAKTGNANLRTALYFSALSAIRFNPLLRRFADRLRLRRKSSMTDHYRRDAQTLDLSLRRSQVGSLRPSVTHERIKAVAVCRRAKRQLVNLHRHIIEKQSICSLGFGCGEQSVECDEPLGECFAMMREATSNRINSSALMPTAFVQMEFRRGIFATANLEVYAPLHRRSDTSRGRASLTTSGRPSMLRPENSATATWAALAVSNSTKPKPFCRCVSRSRTIRMATTVPAVSNRARRVISVVENGIFRTKSVVDM
jgi:hypothetical protein